jgi:hypothetical protein
MRRALVLIGLLAVATLAGLARAAEPPPSKPKAVARCATPEYRQLDFWIGDRDAYDVDAPGKVVEVGPAVVARANHIDLCSLRPVLADLEGGDDPLLAVEPGEGFAETLEAEAEVGVEVGADEVPEPAVGPM